MIKSSILTFLLAIIYILDEKINTVLGFNGGGFLFLLILYVLVISHIQLSVSALTFGCVLILYSLFTSYFSPCDFNYKSALSFALMIPFLLILNIKTFNKIISTDLISKFLLIILMISILFNEFLNIDNRFFRFFYENSWTALYASPFIIYRILSNSKDVYSWFAVLVISVFCFSTTFFILMSLLFLILLLKSKKLIYFAPFALLSLMYYSFNNIAIMDRVDTILNYDNHTGGNLSSFVWLNGFSMAHHNFITTSGLGVGLNQMGCLTETYASGNFSSVIENITGGILLNSEDGSFLSAKLISEFGIFGFLIVLSLLIFAIRNLLIYIFNKSSYSINLDCIVGSIVLLVLLFIRAGGYFQLIVILSLSLFFSGLYIKKIDPIGARE
jgi:hypothetical protein